MPTTDVAFAIYVGKPDDLPLFEKVIQICFGLHWEDPRYSNELDAEIHDTYRLIVLALAGAASDPSISPEAQHSTVRRTVGRPMLSLNGHHSPLR